MRVLKFYLLLHLVHASLTYFEYLHVCNFYHLSSTYHLPSMDPSPPTSTFWENSPDIFFIELSPSKRTIQLATFLDDRFLRSVNELVQHIESLSGFPQGHHVDREAGFRKITNEGEIDDICGYLTRLWREDSQAVVWVSALRDGTSRWPEIIPTLIHIELPSPERDCTTSDPSLDVRLFDDENDLVEHIESQACFPHGYHVDREIGIRIYRHDEKAGQDTDWRWRQGQWHMAVIWVTAARNVEKKVGFAGEAWRGVLMGASGGVDSKAQELGSRVQSSQSSLSQQRRLVEHEQIVLARMEMRPQTRDEARGDSVAGEEEADLRTGLAVFGEDGFVHDDEEGRYDGVTDSTDAEPNHSSRSASTTLPSEQIRGENSQERHGFLRRKSFPAVDATNVKRDLLRLVADVDGDKTVKPGLSDTHHANCRFNPHDVRRQDVDKTEHIKSMGGGLGGSGPAEQSAEQDYFTHQTSRVRSSAQNLSPTESAASTSTLLSDGT